MYTPNKKLITVVNFIAVTLYIVFVYYSVSKSSGDLQAILFSFVFAIFFASYFPIRTILLKRFTKEKEFLYITVPWVVAFFIIQEIAFS